MTERPKFLPSFLDEIKKESERASFLALIPYVFLLSCGVGAVVAYYIPAAFFANDKWDVSTAVYAGLLTFDGLVLVLGWNAFSRMYDVLLRGDLGKYMMKNQLLNPYLVHITFMHIVQISAVLVAALGLVTVIMDVVPLGADRAIFAVTIALTIYSIKQALSAVRAMNDLVWQAAFFETHKPKEGTNVTPLRGAN